MYTKRFIFIISALAVFFIIPHAQAAFDLPDFDKIIEPVIQPIINPQVCTPNTRVVMRCDNRLWGFRTCNAQGTDWNIEQSCQYTTEAQAQAVLTPPTSTPVLNPETIRTLINLLGQPAAAPAPAPAEVNTSPDVFERVNGRDVPLDRAANRNFLLRFGETTRETTKTIIIKNGNSPLAIGAYGFDNGSDRAFSFPRGSNCLGALAAQETCSMAIKFTPDAAQWRLEVFGEIYIESGGRRVVLITTEAIHGATPSIIAETPSTNALIPYRMLQKNADGTPILDWGGTATAVTKSLVLRNAGSINLSIPSTRLDADPTHAFDFPIGSGCLGSVQPGQRCTMQVRFTPQQGTGLAVSRLIFETNVPTLPGARHEFTVELHATSLLDAIQQPNLDPTLLQGILGVFGAPAPAPAPAEPEEDRSITDVLTPQVIDAILNFRVQGQAQLPELDPEVIAALINIAVPEEAGQQSPELDQSTIDAVLKAFNARPDKDSLNRLLDALAEQEENEQLMAQVIQDLLAHLGQQGDASDDVMIAGVLEDLLAAFGQQQLNRAAVGAGAQAGANVVPPIEHVNVDRVEQLADAYAQAAASPNADEDTKNTATQLQKLTDILRAEQQQKKDQPSTLPDSTSGYTILLIGSAILLLAIIAGFMVWVMKM